MACGCQKGKAQETSAAERSTRAARNQREQEARAATSTRTLDGARTVPVMQGGSQSFALRTTDGRTQSFGSLLEARAERARHGGTILSS